MKQIASKTLEEVWVKGLKYLLDNGVLIDEKESFKEVGNFCLSYSNSFEITSKYYIDAFGDKFLKYMERVYSPEGDKETGRNYYKLIFEQNGVNQVEKVVDVLSRDPFSRSGIIVLANPLTDKKPCVLEVSFSVRDGLLNMTVLFKSSDFAKKFIPDMIELSKIHMKVSQGLNIARGEVSVLILCAQLYVDDKKIVTEVVKKNRKNIFYKIEKIIENWDMEAERWDLNINNPNHYVNFENGYLRFLDFLEKNIPIVSKGIFKVALDSGCGTGVVSEMLNKKGYNSIGIDLSPKMLEHAHQQKGSRKYVLANSLDIPYEDSSFDIICSRGVLISHVGKNYVNLFIKEHSRVLKQGGLFIFDFITHFNKNEIKKKKNKAYLSFDEVAKLLVDNGFKVLGRSGDDINRVNAIFCKKLE